jgi:hypothetical protein
MSDAPRQPAAAPVEIAGRPQAVAYERSQVRSGSAIALCAQCSWLGATLLALSARGKQNGLTALVVIVVAFTVQLPASLRHATRPRPL